MTLQAWIPPAGEVVEPPVHTETIVDVLFSDRSEQTGAACLFNWSGEGDGPKIIAYSVVSEYVEPVKPHEVLPEAPLDLTKITTPFGLLDEATQAALKAHGGPYEWWDVDCDFVGVVDQPVWAARIVYRVAPSAAPAKPAPREVVAWAVVDDPTDKVEVIRAGVTLFFDEGKAMEHQRQYGGTVRPLGFLP